ncbi:MAG: integrase [Geminicoccaceae bacterium]|jgi:integrase|nr:integrase [Microvirga sp.]MCE3246528.1 integrase [Geminicoccaceae bacterium]
MATIRKRSWQTKDGEKTAWVADYLDQHGKRRLKTFATKKAADAWMVTARHQVASGTHTPESTSAMIGEAVELWIQRAEAEGLERATLDQYRQHRGHILALIPAGERLAKLTTARCEQLRDDLVAGHKRPMARKVLQSFKSVLKDAKRRGLVAQNVAADTTIGKDKRHKRKLKAGVDFPLPAELRAMLEAADPKAKALVCLAALAGLRASELRGLRWSSLDLGAKPSVTVNERADRWNSVGSPKSASSRRAIPLGEVATRVLKEWRLAQPPGRSLVFGTAADRPDVLGNLQRRLLTPLCAAAGAPRYGWHSLRHYAISSWLASGIDLKTAQHWAGHATLALTLDTYGHLIPRADDHQRIAAAERGLFG